MSSCEVEHHPLGYWHNLPSSCYRLSDWRKTLSSWYLSLTYEIRASASELLKLFSEQRVAYTDVRITLLDI
jgi:hypothetical protein